MNTANKLTLTRIVMIPVFLAVLYLVIEPYSRYIALAVFILASVTDFIDGYVARHYDQVTDFGKFVDPLADKMLVISAMLWFVEVGRMPAWALLIVVAREFAVSGLRLVAANGGKVIAAGMSGKVKTFSTMICICVMLLLPGMPVLDYICVGIILVTTIYSGVEYFIQNKSVIDWNNL